MTSRRPRLRALDGLRALAALTVFAYHVHAHIAAGGWIGVDLFFVISGFLITGALLAEHDRTGRIDLLCFYRRRGLRLIPALVALVVIVAPLSLVIGQPLRRVAEALSALLYLMNVYAPLAKTGGLLEHTWSLAAEQQFYLVWPLVLLLSWRWRQSPVVAAVAVSLLCVAMSAAFTEFGVSAIEEYEAPFSHAPVILAGAVLAVLLRRRPVFPKRVAGPAGWLALAAFLAACLLMDQDMGWLAEGGYLAVAVGMGVLVCAVVTDPESSLARVLSIRWLTWLGERSYGFYLWHYPVTYLLEWWTGMRPWGLTLIGLPVSLIAMEMSWRLVETPFNRRRALDASTGHELDVRMAVSLPVDEPSDPHS